MTQTAPDHVAMTAPTGRWFSLDAGPIVVAAFFGALVVAIAALIVAAPPLRLGGLIAGPILLVAWLAAATLGARQGGAPLRALAGAIAGVGTALLLLIFLGSLLTRPMVADPASAPDGAPVAALRPGAPILVAGFLGLGAVMGVLGSTVARLRPAARPSQWPWTARLALIATAATLPLLLLGGLVTSTESGMAVPDWPGSYGANMFLFPVGLMAEPRVFLEHSHRLFGSLVGAATVATALGVHFGRPGGARAGSAARVVAWIAVPLVIIQGVLGGTRVTENNLGLAIGHGILGQVFFMTLAALVAMLLPAWATRPATPTGLARLAKVLLGLLLVQLCFGAVFRHLGSRGVHGLYSHIALSLVIVVLAPIVGARLARAASEGGAPGQSRRIGKAISHATAFQFLLGWGALAGAMMGSSRGPVPLHTQLAEAARVPLWEVVLTTLHQANGAILLVMAGLAVVWTCRRLHAAGGGAPASANSRATSPGGSDATA